MTGLLKTAMTGTKTVERSGENGQSANPAVTASSRLENKKAKWFHNPI